MRGKGRDQQVLFVCTPERGTKFPSPCGEKVGINRYTPRGLEINFSDVSVPLRGKGRDQQEIGGRNYYWNYTFPSPCGEKVGINRGWFWCGGGGKPPFPSPCGEKVGINGPWVEYEGFAEQYVSVPLRGKGRDQHRYLRGPVPGGSFVVSVPLRGKGRDQRSQPSGPAGAEGQDCFRPLAGKR